VKLQISGHLDEHAEKALDELTLPIPKTPTRLNAKAVTVGRLFVFHQG